MPTNCSFHGREQFIPEPDSTGSSHTYNCSNDATNDTSDNIPHHSADNRSDNIPYHSAEHRSDNIPHYSADHCTYNRSYDATDDHSNDIPHYSANHSSDDYSNDHADTARACRFIYHTGAWLEFRLCPHGAGGWF